MANRSGSPGGARVVLTEASTIIPEPVEWLWHERLPRKELSLIAGEPGLGKSTQTIELAARISRGELDGALHGQPRDVLLASAEDHFASVILGRLRAAGADLERVHNVDVAERGHRGLLTLPDHVEAIEWECAGLHVERGREVALLVVDPISAFITGTVDTHKDASVRRVLAALAGLAERQEFAVLGVAHLNKSESVKLLNRVTGSGAWTAAARSVLVFARHPDDPNGEQGAERVIVHVKSNYGTYAPTLAARIESTPVAGIGTVSRLVLDGECEVGPDDLRPRKGDGSAEDCEQAILTALADGPRPSHEIKAEVAEGQGCSWRTVERAAKRLADRDQLEITSQKFPRRTFWTVTSSAQSGRDVTEDDATEEPRMAKRDSAVSGSQSRHVPGGDVTDAPGAERNGGAGSRRLDSEDAPLATPEQEAKAARLGIDLYDDGGRA